MAGAGSGRPSGRVRGRAPLQDLRRASEIVQILFQHGFGYLLDSSALATAGVEPAETGAAAAELPFVERVRAVLEALGPTYVKLGQILSTRADIVPSELAQALTALQDRAPPLPFEDVQMMVERDLGRPLGEAFLHFDREPLATASIAQVHRARIAHGDGELEVVCKVQRPGIRKTMLSDLSLLFWLSKLLEGTIEEVSAYSPTAIVEQFEKAVLEELDFVHERENLERAGQNFADVTDMALIPQPQPDLCGPHVLTMTFLDGVKITDVRDDPAFDKTALLDKLVRAAFKQVFEDGFFHGDPHPGNVLVLTDGRLGLIDHGLWGRLSTDQRDALTQWLMAIALKSPSTMARLTLKIGQVGPGFDRLAYERDLRELMDRYVGIELSAVDANSVLSDSVELIRKHRIKIPPSFAILARATATLEGIVRELYPGLNFQELILPYVQQLMLRRFDLSRAGPEALALVLGVQDFVNEVPGQLNQLLLDLGAGRFRVQLQGQSLDELARVGRLHSIRTIGAVFAGALLIATAISLVPVADRLVFRGVPLLPVLGVLALCAVLGGIGLTFMFPRGWQKIRLSRFGWWRRRR